MKYLRLLRAKTLVLGVVSEPEDAPPLLTRAQQRSLRESQKGKGKGRRRGRGTAEDDDDDVEGASEHGDDIPEAGEKVKESAGVPTEVAEPVEHKKPGRKRRVRNQQEQPLAEAPNTSDPVDDGRERQPKRKARKQVPSAEEPKPTAKESNASNVVHKKPAAKRSKEEQEPAPKAKAKAAPKAKAKGQAKAKAKAKAKANAKQPPNRAVPMADRDGLKKFFGVTHFMFAFYFVRASFSATCWSSFLLMDFDGSFICIGYPEADEGQRPLQVGAILEPVPCGGPSPCG